MASIFDPNNPTAFNLLGNQQQQPFTISQENYQQPSTSANASGMNRNQRIGFMLAALSDAFAGRDVAGRALERSQVIRQQAEVDRQRQEAIERQKTIQSLGSNLTEEQKTLARLFPSEYADYVFSRDTRPQISLIQQQESEFLKEAAKAGFKTQEEAQKQIEQYSDIENRLDILQKQLEGADPVQTGVIEEIKIPFKRLAAGLNVLPQEELDKLSQQELFIATTGYIIPRMRVAGSGSTSDREIELFKSAVPNLGNTVDGNKVLVGGLQSIAKYNKKRLFEMDKYLKENKNLLGFGEFADKKLGPLYKQYNSDDDFDLQVKQGNLKAGDFVFDAINGQFRILDKEDIKGIN